MARLIDAEPILMRWNTEMLGRKDMYDMVKNAPAIDIVRCKDCKRQDNCLKQVVMNSEESKFDVFYKSVGFCSYGERKDDEL